MDAGSGTLALTVRKRGYQDKQISVQMDRDSDQEVVLRSAVKRSPQVETSQDVDSELRSTDTSKPASGSLDPFEKLDSKKRRAK